eukprot:scaffold6231_cov215-Prasinococcus_capsulatus_cf.AAC.1
MAPTRSSTRTKSSAASHGNLCKRRCRARLVRKAERAVRYADVCRRQHGYVYAPTAAKHPSKNTSSLHTAQHLLYLLLSRWTP